MRTAVARLVKYIGSYDKQGGYLDYADATFIDDVLYGLGIALHGDKMAFAAGYEHWKQRLRAHLGEAPAPEGRGTTERQPHDEQPPTRAEIATRLHGLATEMDSLAAAMDYYGGFARWAQHGREIAGAGNIARQWAAEIVACEPAGSAPLPGAVPASLTWRVHTGLLPDRVEELRALFEPGAPLHGDTLQLVHGPVRGMPLPPPGEAGSPGLALTTLQDARRLREGPEKWGALPGLYFDPARAAVTHWMSRMNPQIPVLNRAGFLTTAALLPTLGAPLEGGVFLRPDSGQKPFTGFAVAPEKARDWAAVQTELLQVARHLPLDTLLHVSPARKLGPVEWRFWIVNRKVVAWSPYSWDEDEVHAAPGRELGPLDVAKQVAANAWQMDIAYVADVVECEGRWFLNELNAGSTSGLYQTPFEPLLTALRAAALAELRGELSLED